MFIKISSFFFAFNEYFNSIDADNLEIREDNVQLLL